MKPPNEQNSPWVMDTNAETFDQDVFERSKVTPVVVDFWSTFCRPCHVLAPILQDLAEEYQGQFVLVKANTDELPQCATQFPIRGVPTVFAIVDGKITDSFEGIPSSDELHSWIDRVLLSQALSEAESVEASEPDRAEAT